MTKSSLLRLLLCILVLVSVILLFALPSNVDRDLSVGSTYPKSEVSPITEAVLEPESPAPADLAESAERRRMAEALAAAEARAATEAQAAVEARAQAEALAAELAVAELAVAELAVAELAEVELAEVELAEVDNLEAGTLERSELLAALTAERELRYALEQGLRDGAESASSAPTNEPGLLAARLNKELQASQLIDRLSKAPATYNRLTELWYRQPETVVFRVDLTSADAPNLPDTLEGDRVDIETPVSPEMSVELTGTAGLDIDPKGRIKKRVSDVAATSWEWKVTPEMSGRQSLSLTVYVHVSDDRKSEPHTIRTYEDTIIVNVKALDRVKMAVSSVQPIWAFGALVITGLIGAYGWIRSKGWRTEKNTPSP